MTSIAVSGGSRRSGDPSAPREGAGWWIRERDERSGVDTVERTEARKGRGTRCEAQERGAGVGVDEHECGARGEHSSCCKRSACAREDLCGLCGLATHGERVVECNDRDRCACAAGGLGTHHRLNTPSVRTARVRCGCGRCA